MKRVVLVTNIPAPYRIPLFNELDDQLGQAGYSFYVLFGGATYSRRKWEVDLSSCRFSYQILTSRTVRQGWSSERTAFMYSGLNSLLIELEPDLIIVPGFSLATVKAWWFSKFKKCKYIIWTGGTGRNKSHRSSLRKMLRQFLAKEAGAAIVYGSLAGAYMRSLGVAKTKVFVGINTVDTTYYQAAVAQYRQQMAKQDGKKKHLTYIGYLSRRKNVRRLLEVGAALATQRTDFVLEIVGDGEDLDKLKAYVNACGLTSFVVFQGYQQKKDLPQFLARSHGFLFQTDFDIWGLVLNEAMAASLPCLASCNAGATEDLVEDGKTGFRIDFSDSKMAVDRINWILDNPAAARQIGANANRFVSMHASMDRSARGFVQAVQYVSNTQYREQLAR